METLDSKKVERERSSNIELLRILMMLSLIAHHFTVNSGFTDMYNYNQITGNMIFLQIFSMWGKTAINIFCLISGYYMVNRIMTRKKIAKLVLEVMFYVVLFYIIFLITGYEPFELKELIKTVFCIPYEAGTLYVGSMIVMMCFVPFANILANAITKRQYQILLIGLLIYFTGISTFLKHDTFDFVFWMLSVYLIGGYLRLYPPVWDSLKTGGIWTFISAICMVGSIIVIDFIGTKYGITAYHYFLSDANKILAVTAAVSIFVLFKNWTMKYNKMINIMASTTFGVLMLHANSSTMRRFLWTDLFHNTDFYDSRFLVLYACTVVILVYAAGVVFDLLRIKFLERPLFKKLDKYAWLSKPLC